MNQKTKNIMDLPVEDQKKIIEQYEAVRRSGKFNMFSFFDVQREAHDNEFYDFVNFTDNDSKAYVTILKNYSDLAKLINEDDVPYLDSDLIDGDDWDDDDDDYDDPNYRDVPDGDGVESSNW